MHPAEFSVLNSNSGLFVISDDNSSTSVTNDIRNVILSCKQKFGFKPNEQAFIYYDSEGIPTNVLCGNDGEFVDYRHPSQDLFNQLQSLDLPVMLD